MLSAASASLIAERAREFAAIMATPLAGAAAHRDAVARLGELRRLIDGAGVELAGRIEDLMRDPDAARAMGERSAAMVLQADAGLDGPEAHAWCRVGAELQPRVSLQGELLPSPHDDLSEALAAGRIRVGGAERVLAVLHEIEPFASPAECLEVERFLIDHARGLTDRQFARLCRAIPDRFVPDGDGAAREELLRQRSGLVVRHTAEGLVRWIVTMHPEAAGFATAALDARTAPRRQPAFRDADGSDPDPLLPPAGTRPLHQRRLDAFVSIVRESVGQDSGKLAGAAVTMLVTVSLDALRSGLGTARISGIDEPISAGTARRLAADADIIPAVLGTPSECLDLGRQARLASEPQRRALELRDRGCIWGTCSAPPGWCEVAHIVPWARGGTTDLDNMMLLCPFHHRCFDLDDWRLERIGDERYLIPPPWIDPSQTPRRAGPLPVLAA